MEGGRDWWFQITEALDQVEFMALVIGPHALKSDIVRKEWRYARQKGVCVYPIKGSPNLDFGSVPRWMHSSHFYDLGTIENDLNGPEWEKFINDLNTSCQAKRVAFMVEDLPEGFVPRPGEFDQLLKLLIDERREEPVAITAALKGAGGYGKTTLAKALCHDERIQDAFDDGILWVTLGENPGDLTGRVEDLIVTLTDERPGFTAQDAAVNRLKELLEDRDILIVIDDVWDRAHLNPFIQGGPRCARLITTRNFDTLPTSAERVHVDAMRQTEATDLLAAGLNLQDTLREELAALASRLGEWPLLLRLVNSALRSRIENDKQSPRDAIRWIDTALKKRGLTYFDAHNSEARDQAVARTIGISLDLLSPTDRERYGELGIFPEDVEIPLVLLEKLWATTGKFDEFDTEELCSRLNRFSLLWSYDANQRRIRLHDVVRKFLIEQQGEKLESIHNQLLDSYRPAAPSSWSQMDEDEPYLWDHLAHHLIEAGRSDELVATVKEWRYLVAKTFVRKSLATEADLLAAEAVVPNDDALRLLRRNFVNSGHLLNRCKTKPDVETTLFSRLQHLEDLQPLTTDLKQHLNRPAIVPIFKLPDLPHPALIRTLSGHTSLPNGCAISADAGVIVASSIDGTLKVWDGSTGAERLTLCEPGVVINGCSVSADGGTIVSASADGTLTIWDGRTGAKRFRLCGHTAGVTSCAVSADGTTIVSVSEDWTLRVWDGHNGEERFKLSDKASWLRNCAVSADGATIVSGVDDGSLRVWDGNTGAQLLALSVPKDWLTKCAVSADGKTIVSAAAGATLMVWDAHTGVERFNLSGHTDWITGCAVNADGTTIVSSSEDRTVRVWDGRTGLERFALIGHAGSVSNCAVNANGASIVSISDEYSVKIWDGRTGAEQLSLSSHAAPMSGCAVSADGATIVSGSFTGKGKVWDGLTGAERFTLRAHEGWVVRCALSADGATIASVCGNNTVKVWDGRTGAERYSLRSQANRFNSCAVSADGSIIVSASSDWALEVWDGPTGRRRFTLTGHENEVNDCATNADGTIIVSASDDFSLKVWDGRTSGERLTLKGHVNGVSACAVSGDGTTVVSASHDHTVKVWDGRTGTERATLNHKAALSGCAIDVDGKMLVSTSLDGTLKIWNVRTAECLSTVHVDGPLHCCSCSADGEIIVAAGPRGIYFFRLLV